MWIGFFIIECFYLLNKVLQVQVCDATKVERCTIAGIIKKKLPAAS